MGDAGAGGGGGNIHCEDGQALKQEPERLWSHHPWRFPRANWTKS